MDGVRSHRYHVTRRYCGMCAPLRAVGGLIGAGWVGAGVVIVGAIAAFVVLRWGMDSQRHEAEGKVVANLQSAGAGGTVETALARPRALLTPGPRAKPAGAP